MPCEIGKHGALKGSQPQARPTVRDPLLPKPKRKKRVSPTKLTKVWLSARGFVFDVVEQRIPTTFITKDFLGCIDIIAAHPRMGILGLQVTGATASGNHVEREKKIAAEARAVRWMECGGKIMVFSWSLRGKAGTRKEWQLRASVAVLDGLEMSFVPVEEIDVAFPLSSPAAAGCGR